MEGRFEQDGAVLEQGVVDASTGARQAVEVVEIKLGGHNHDNTDISSQSASQPGPYRPGGRLRRRKQRGPKKRSKVVAYG